MRGRLGNMGVVGEHDGDRLADEADLVEREDRLVVECRAVIRVGNDCADVLAGDDAVHARKFLLLPLCRST